MEKILAALAEFKSYFTGITASLAKVTAAEDRVKALEAELATEKANSAAKDTKVQALTTDLQTAQEQVNAKGTEIKDLTSKLEVANKRANDTLAAQGLRPEDVPASASGENSGSSNSETAFAKYERLRNTDSRAAGAFYAANADAIFASRPKS